jgi:L-threonylcarbamoyladenylate synthase
MKPLLWSDSESHVLLVDTLKKGNVVLVAGDTVLGLLADISERGCVQLDAIKKRSNQPYLLLVENKQKALQLIENDARKICQIEKIMNICWPGPATLILKAKAEVPEGVKSPDGTIAIRVPDHAGLLQLLHHFDGLYSTSANLKGQPVPTNWQEVDKSILQAVSAIILNGSESSSILASTIIDCTGDKLKIVRQGAFPVAKLACLWEIEV